MSIFILIYDIVCGIFILIDAVLVFGFLYALSEGWKFRPHFYPHASHAQTASGHAAPVADPRRKMVQERWQGIMKKFNEATSNDSRKLAIIEADKLIDTLLKDSGFEGEHMADRLQQLSPEKVTTLDRLWRAHRLRNQIVHSHDFEISPTLTERTIEDYEAFLKETKFLD